MLRAVGTVSLLLLLAPGLGGAAVPSVPLYNAAKPGTLMPTVGLGTGGYGNVNGTGGEYWNNDVAQAAVQAWLEAGGRRIDTALLYNTQIGVGKGLIASKVPRQEVFITSKSDSPTYGMVPGGYNDTIASVELSLQQLQTTYIDLMLIHWPGLNAAPTKPPPCWQPPNTWRQCRQDSWRALEELFHQGKVRAIGVSNFEPNHIEDIVNLRSLLPAVDQFEYHPFWHTDELVGYCKQRNITLNAYSSLGAPDHMAFRPSEMPVLLPDHPTVKAIAAAHGKTPGQVLARWGTQRGFVVNPRSRSPQHMQENLAIYDFELTHDEVNQLGSIDNPPENVCGDPRRIP